MNIKAALAASSLALAITPLTASAQSTYVYDDAHLFSAAAIERVNAKVGDFQQQSGKSVVVVTVPSLNGKTAPQAAEDAFAQHQINGVEIFVAKAEKQVGVVPDRAASRFFPAGTTSSIRTAIRASFNSGDFDGGLNNGVDLVISQYRSHLGALRNTRVTQPVGVGGGTVQHQNSGGFSMGWIGWILVLAVIFFVVRGIFRAMAGPRMYGPGPGGPGYGPGMGAPGYGPGYGMGGGGGGGFWSGLLGGLGGAFIGNELFGNRGGGFGGGENVSGMGGTDQYQQQDASGFQSDAGQADMSNSSFGGYGDSGGGWGGDSGGGGGWGGGDSGGGGGDSGGGW